MGNVYAEITVKNNRDLFNAQDGIILEKDVRTVTLTAVVDTGATTLVINEDTCQKLGLSIVEDRNINIAGGATMACKVTEPVTIQWKDRQVAINAVVLPEGKTLLGVIPLEFMDLIVDPVRRELIGAHGDQVVLMAL
jgi:clan AA aspartic protease